MRTEWGIARIIQPNAIDLSLTRQSERRRDPRWPYRVRQMVAFHAEYEKPTEEMFQTVRCHDISLGGISFFLSGRPPRQYCTLVLGRAPYRIFVKGQVAHFEPTGLSPDEWIVGCEFLAKLNAFPVRELSSVD